MSPTATHDGDLDQVVELNRLFLRVLKTRADNREACFGLGTALARRLRAASRELVDGLAELPRALFSLNLDPARPFAVTDAGRRPGLDSATQSLQLTVLLTAWNFSRRSPYPARLFLGLSAAQVRALRTLPLSDLPPLAAAEGLVVCAFAETAWLWRELLTEQVRPEHRRQLMLVALQPQTLVARDAARRALSG